MGDIARATSLTDGNPAYAADFHGLLDNATIKTAVVTNAKLANMAAGTIKGAVNSGPPSDLTAAQVQQILGAALKYTLAQTAHGFVAGNVLRFNSGTGHWSLAQADSVTDARVLGVVESVPDANTAVVVINGAITLPGLTAGSTYYLSSTTAGATVTPAPASGFYLTGNVTAGNPIVAGLSSTATLSPGMSVQGPGVAGLTISSIIDGTSYQLSGNPTVNGTAVKLLYANAREVPIYTAISASQAIVNIGVDPAQLLSTVNALSEVNPALARANLLIDQRTPVADSNYTILPTDRYVGITAITAARAFILPAASSVNAGQALTIADESGLVSGALQVTLTRAGADTVSGATGLVMSSPYQVLVLYSDGVSKWTLSAPSKNTARAWVNFCAVPATALAYTRSGTTVTVTHNGHGYATGAMAEITSATDAGNNGIGKAITVIDANHYSFTTAAVGANGTLTVRTMIKAQYNVASITSNGTGDYTITFAANMNDAFYVVTGNAAYLGPSSGGYAAMGFGLACSAANTLALKTTSQVRVQTSYVSGTYYDTAEVSASIFGN